MTPIPKGKRVRRSPTGRESGSELTLYALMPAELTASNAPEDAAGPAPD